MSIPQQEAMHDPRCTRADTCSCRTVRASPSELTARTGDFLFFSYLNEASARPAA
jgi:hypothetical protein